MSPFETGAFSPTKETAESGFTEQDEAWFEVGQEFFYEEQKFSAEIHDAVARWQREHPKKELPRKLLLALGMATVFVSATELAEHVSPEAGSVVSSAKGEKPPVPLDSQDQLARLSRNASDRSPSRVSVMRFGQENDVDGDFLVEAPVDLTGAINGNPLLFHGPVGSLNFVRTTTLDELGKNPFPVVPVGVEIEGSASVQYQDGNNNLVQAFYLRDPKTGVIEETINVHTSWVFSDRPEPQPLDVDLSPLGYGVIEGAFYVAPLVRVGEHSGYAYFTSETSGINARELMAERGEAIAKGIQEALSLFGLPANAITGVTIVDRGFSNAFAASRTRQIIYFTDELLKGPGQKGIWERLSEGEGLTGEAVASVAAHEVFHQIDHAWGLTTDARIQSLFRRLDQGDLYRVNEKRDGRLLGGHAEDNEAELFASFMTTIRGDNWERRKEWITLEDVVVYEEIVDVFLDRLKDVPVLKRAPIHELLLERQEELNRRMLELRQVPRAT